MYVPNYCTYPHSISQLSLYIIFSLDPIKYPNDIFQWYIPIVDLSIYINIYVQTYPNDVYHYVSQLHIPIIYLTLHDSCNIIYIYMSQSYISLISLYILVVRIFPVLFIYTPYTNDISQFCIAISLPSLKKMELWVITVSFSIHSTLW